MVPINATLKSMATPVSIGSNNTAILMITSAAIIKIILALMCNPFLPTKITHNETRVTLRAKYS